MCAVLDCVFLIDLLFSSLAEGRFRDADDVTGVQIHLMLVSSAHTRHVHRRRASTMFSESERKRKNGILWWIYVDTRSQSFVCLFRPERGLGGQRSQRRSLISDHPWKKYTTIRPPESLYHARVRARERGLDVIETQKWSKLLVKEKISPVNLHHDRVL